MIPITYMERERAERERWVNALGTDGYRWVQMGTGPDVMSGICSLLK